jgi:hypothetical protein
MMRVAVGVDAAAEMDGVDEEVDGATETGPGPRLLNWRLTRSLAY